MSATKTTPITIKPTATAGTVVSVHG